MATEETSLARSIWSLGNYHKIALEHQIASEQLVVETVVRAGQKVLDLACGSGNTTLAAARRRAHVTASDAVPDMIEMTRKRVEAEGVTGVEYHVGDTAAALPFADAAFDAVLSSFGASFFADQQRVMDEMLRVIRPGGTIGLTLWEAASLPSDFFRAGQSLSKETAIDKIAPAYQLAQGDFLSERVKGRAASIRFVPATFEACYPSFDEYVETHVTNHPPAILRLSKYTDDQRQQYKDMLRRIAKDYNRATDGSVAILMNYVIIVIVKA